ncbi:fibronectin type III domain-containing protein [Wukongibacter sp. M2B1]|uniref:fibronectin type III domain-containing protein n=1 Tax=Wukongibacter sp. M2B1 TaxID=3088895 RepID=UPI003D78FB08
MKLRKLGVYFIVAMLMVSFVFIGTGIQVYAAEVGDQLLEPEDGWERYDIAPSENFIISEKISFKGNYTNYPSWNQTIIWTTYSDETLKFKFQGTKIRVIGFPGSARADDITISIDGVIESMPYHKASGYQPMDLIYEKTGLENKVHEVIITSGTNASGSDYDLVLDAIDIDEDGELKPYDDVISMPDAPENLKTAAGDEEVGLSWDEVEDVDSYIIKRSETEGGPYTIIEEDITGTSYTDRDVENGTTYYYVVSAVIDGDESDDSNEASATPEGSSSGSGDKAILRITMQNGKINEYDLSIDDVEDFIDWFEDRDDPYYIIEKDYNIGPFESRKDYIVADKILQFEVMEYED